MSIANASELAAKFVQVATAQGQSGLDYSAQSLRVVDDILDGFYNGGNKVEEMGGTILVASSYVGEVFRLTAGAVWVDGETADVPDIMRFPMIMSLNEIYLVPYAKVSKRIENGPEDDLVFYYQVMMKQAGLEPAPVSPRPAPPAKKGLLARLFGKGA